MIQVRRFLAFLFTLLQITFVLVFFPSLNDVFFTPQIGYFASVELKYSLILLVFLYQIVWQAYCGSYFPIKYFFPLLPELIVVSNKLSFRLDSSYHRMTKFCLRLFTPRSHFEDTATKIVRTRAGHILKNTFFTLTFSWVMLLYYQNIDSDPHNRIITGLLQGLQSVSSSIPLNYIVAQLGGIILAYASVRAVSLEIDHSSEAERYRFSYQVFGELISGVILLTVGILFPAFQSLYYFGKSIVEFPDFAAALLILIISILFVTSMKSLFVSIIIGILGLFDLVLIAIFASLIGLQDELAILALLAAFAIFAYGIYKSIEYLIADYIAKFKIFLEYRGLIRIE